jgi:UDPglucose--hexose-1-phosphate uridylyltransferase
MPELRRDPITGRYVILSPERALRPSEFLRAPAAHRSGLCPFDAGSEQYTPPEILAYRPPGLPANGPGWTVRVFPNRFPALRVEGTLQSEGDGIFDRLSGIGAHEVIVDSPAHDRTLAQLETSEIAAVLGAFRERILDLGRDQRLRSVILFKNHGAEAGSTLEHSHCQLIALPLIPATLAEELAGALAHHQQKDRCIYCDILRQERKDGVRVVGENAEALALAPWASRAAFETWILPRAHASAFEDSSTEQLHATAELLGSTLRRINAALDTPAYNLMLHSGPLNQRGLPHYHWHFEILPVVSRIGGFEWGSGLYINPTPPEEAAEFLRKVRP